MNARAIGLYNKFEVTRHDGRSAPGEKHDGCDYFVLDLTHDRHALPALAAYADACRAEYPALAADLQSKVAGMVAALSCYITVPEVTLPCGTIVPSFQVAKHISSRGPTGIPQSVTNAAPWVEISYHEARETCAAAGVQLITELQWLAIAHDIVGQDINWTGGKVGEGKLFQGLHKVTVDSGQPGSFESEDLEERRWHQLSNGERIFDFAGNVFSWVFDDVQGDDQGLIAKAFAEDSPSLTTAPFPSMEKGMGWRPRPGSDWSGDALIRGGCWDSESNAGVFYLDDGWPEHANDYVGFRCTK